MSNNNTPINDDLLVKYLVGEATPDESILVEEWIKAGDNNRKYFNQLRQVWEESEAATESSTVDEDAAWSRLQKRMHPVNEPTVRFSPVITEEAPVEEPVVLPIRPKKKRFRWMAVAASLLVICAAGYFAWNYFGTATHQVRLYSGNVVLLDTLPDGSVVTLNNLTRLSYPEKFKGSKREVTLQGEAFFKVAHNVIKPFIINAEGVTIKVTGTSFNVKSRNGKTEVSVDEGTVNVSKGSASAELHAGEKVEVNKGSDRFVKETQKSKLYGYYATGELVCVQTPLKDLVAALRDIYGADIVIQNPSIENLPITTTFKNKTIDQILIIVAETFNISIDYQGSQIILK